MNTLTALVGHTRSLCLVLLAAFAAQSQAQNIQPGEWQFWQSDTVQVPSKQAGRVFCLSASDAKDPAVFIGDTPRDPSCKISNVRKRPDGGFNFDMDCGDGVKFTASTTVSVSRAELTTQQVPVLSNSADAKISYVHGKRLQSCEK
jgi:hypothetical protein